MRHESPSSRWPASANKPLSFTSAPELVFLVADSRTCVRLQWGVLTCFVQCPGLPAISQVGSALSLSTSMTTSHWPHQGQWHHPIYLRSCPQMKRKKAGSWSFSQWKGLFSLDWPRELVQGWSPQGEEEPSPGPALLHPSPAHGPSQARCPSPLQASCLDREFSGLHLWDLVKLSVQCESQLLQGR